MASFVIIKRSLLEVGGSGEKFVVTPDIVFDRSFEVLCSEGA